MLNQQAAAKRTYDLEERLIQFTVRIMALIEGLPATRVGNHIAGQLVRSGTSPVANYSEAESAESRDDFVHKLKIALKELRETRVWLTLIQRMALGKSATATEPLLGECNELISILVASVRTARRNQARPGAES